MILTLLKPVRNTLTTWARPAFICLMAITLLLSCRTAHAQSPQAEKAGADKGKSEIADYVRNKYKVRYLDSQMRKTAHGPSGTIYIIGDITPKNIGTAMAEAKKPDRARGIAKALIFGEPDIFGVVHQKELREMSLETDTYGHTHILYKRYIDGLPLDNMEIMAHISPDDKLSTISAVAVPVPPELYSAAKKETIKEDALPSIIEQDLKESNIAYKSIRISKSGKIAVPVPPHVLWQADVSAEGNIESWTYRVDAFSGTVIEKRSTLIE